MSDAAKPGEPPLAALVRAGEDQKEAVAIEDFIFMVKDISNAYLVTTADGDVLVNAGFMDNAERNKPLLAARRTGPLRKIILTQAHPDHYGGVPVLREAESQIIAERRFTETWRYFRDLGPFLARRTGKLWASTMRRGSTPAPPPEIVPDIEVDRDYAFELGGRRFELLSTPGGETLCSLVVWMPKERVVFTGNLFGPVFLSTPNLNTLRGDKPRLVQTFLSSLDRVRSLGAALLITGHGEPIRGEEWIRADLDKLHGAVSYLNETTIAGMNAGKDLYTLMREIRLPEALQIAEAHGKVSWAIRSIWHEYAGWFLYDSTTSLYAVPRASIDADLVELAGGASALATRAQQKLAAGQPLEALHLLDIALDVAPDQADALAVKKEVLDRLLKESGGTNFSETMWLRSELASVDKKLAAG